MPNRVLVQNPNKVISSADGTIVVVEQVFESEILKEECLQISTFMSPNNIHVNRYPVSGKVIYTNYHSGKYLIAKHPKSSILNERTTICIETERGKKIVVRQIAGALARRIVCYAKQGEQVTQGEELGFIKFGSRVDLFIPLDSEIHVEIEDKVKGGLSVLATL
jgi:phosphatidylserine decarboxylase